MILEVLVEGEADVPAVREILTRRFRLTDQVDFRIHPHRGKGRLPRDLARRPEIHHRGLLDQLPAKLRGYAKSYADVAYAVVLLVDADDDDCRALKQSLTAAYNAIEPRPPIFLVRIAVEETESWFIADVTAVKAAYPKAATHGLQRLVPDSICGAWEQLATALGHAPAECTGADKHGWAERITPLLNLSAPRSPSLRAFISGVAQILGETT